MIISSLRLSDRTGTGSICGLIQTHQFLCYPLFWLKFTPWQALNCHSRSHLSAWFSTIQYCSKAYLNPNENPIDNLLPDPLMNIDWKMGSGLEWSSLGLTWASQQRRGEGRRLSEGKKNGHQNEECIKNPQRGRTGGLMGSMVCPFTKSIQMYLESRLKKKLNCNFPDEEVP